MESYVQGIIHFLQEQEEIINQSPTLLEFEQVSRSLIQLAYNMVESIDDLYQKLDILEQQLFIKDEQYQKDLSQIQSDLTDQKKHYQEFMETCRLNEENFCQNEQQYNQRIQALESQLKILELDLISQQLKFSEYVKYYEEELTKKNIIISQKDLQQNNTTQVLQGQEQNIDSLKGEKDCLTVSKVQYPINDYVSIDCLERVEEEKFQNNCQIIVQKCSYQSSLASLDFQKTNKNLQLMKIPTIESNLEYPKRIAFSNLQSKFTSQLHIRNNSIGINLPINNNTTNVSYSLDKQNSNSYQHFFQLISQCVKLDMQINEIYTINTNHLYEQFIQSKTPFNKWYNQIKEYLLSEVQSK